MFFISHFGMPELFNFFTTVFLALWLVSFLSGQTSFRGEFSFMRYVQKCRQWRKWRRNLVKVFDEIIRANKLTQLEGPQNVSENEKSGDFGKIWPIAKVVNEMIRANKLTQLEGLQNVGECGENGEFGENGNFGTISPRLSTKWQERIN